MDPGSHPAIVASKDQFLEFLHSQINVLDLFCQLINPCGEINTCNSPVTKGWPRMALKVSQGAGMKGKKWTAVFSGSVLVCLQLLSMTGNN